MTRDCQYLIRSSRGSPSEVAPLRMSSGTNEELLDDVGLPGLHSIGGMARCQPRPHARLRVVNLLVALHLNRQRSLGGVASPSHQPKNVVKKTSHYCTYVIPQLCPEQPRRGVAKQWEGTLNTQSPQALSY
jgi:hypothetical protein